MGDSFDLYGGMSPASPVVLSVPHAGRDYPPALVAALRVPVATLRGLEDRLIDQVALAARHDETLLVQRRARAWIDLNRAEEERDPRVDAGARPPDPLSAKLRSGLGLVPRRASGAGDIWRGRFTAAAIEQRIAEDHRPYHDALAAALIAARARFGTAVLLDLHSMPPLGRDQPRLVVGDRFGQSAGSRFTATVEAAAAAAGIAWARNAPYPGSHLIHRHGRPDRGIHALQVEVDRSLYLDSRLAELGPGFARTAALVRAILDGLADEAGAPPLTQAAE